MPWWIELLIIWLIGGPSLWALYAGTEWLAWKLAPKYFARRRVKHKLKKLKEAYRIPTQHAPVKSAIRDRYNEEYWALMNELKSI